MTQKCIPGVARLAESFRDITLPKTIMSAAAVAASAAVTSTPLASLTRAIGVTGAKLLLSQGYWDPDSNLSNVGGTWTKIQTNQPGASVTLEVTGSKMFGMVVDNIYSATNDGGSRWTVRPPPCRVQRTVDGTLDTSNWSGAQYVDDLGWQYGLIPSIGNWSIANDMVTGSTYRYRIETTHFLVPIGATLRNSRLTLEYMREPASGPYATTEDCAMLQFSAVLANTGATFNTITDARTPVRVLLLADSNMSYVNPVVPPGSPLNMPIGVFGTARTELVDIRGHAITWHRQIIDRWCAANNRPLLLSNASYGGLWMARTSNTISANFRADHPGIASSLHQRFNKRTGWWTDDADPQANTGRAYPGSTNFDLIIVAFVTNDQVLAQAIYGVTGGASELEFGGATFRDDAVTTINAIHAAYSGKLLLVNNQRSDGSLGTPITTHASLAAAAGVGKLNLSGTAWGRYADIRALASEEQIADGQVHMNAADHTTAADLLMPTLNALMAL